MKILFALLFSFTVSIYSLQFPAINGNAVPMSTFQGKKLLLVNLATGSSLAYQIGELQQLQQQFADSLVVIGFPSNSFGHETRTDQQIREYCQTQFGVTFLLAAKNPVIGGNRQSIYNWFAYKIDNGVMDAEINGDFQKILISEQGNIVGIFAPAVSPLDSTLINAIKENY